jgi:3-oxoacyl-[acyl-carrier protein] reductase
VDILVNNAGAARPIKGEDTEAVWEEALALNFTSALRITNPLVGPMKAAAFGRTINVTGAIYSKVVTGAIPSKAALLSWSRALSFELVPTASRSTASRPDASIPCKFWRGCIRPKRRGRPSFATTSRPDALASRRSSLG